jgi:hypothetical protein
MGTKPLHLFEKQGQNKNVTEELFHMKDSSTEGWQYIEGVMDSGAEESVAHPSMSPQYPVVPSVGSRSGQCYTSASGDEIPNLGEQTLPLVTNEGYEFDSKYQSADVSRPLNSVSQICDAGGEDGQLVLFSKWGGTILNLESWRKTPFDRSGGIYTLGAWVKPPGSTAPGFPRQGR